MATVKPVTCLRARAKKTGEQSLLCAQLKLGSEYPPPTASGAQLGSLEEQLGALLVCTKWGILEGSHFGNNKRNSMHLVG